MLIRINLQGSYTSSTTIRVTNTTKASDVCHLIDQKLGIPEDDRIYSSLICVVSGFDGKTNQHWLKTLASGHCVLQFQQYMMDKRKAVSKNFDILNSLICSWYYKDIRSLPLQLDGDMSGNSSSDNEEEIPLNDLIYLGSGDRRAVMQKKSSKDPNLWRRRLYVLTDKLWCINLKKRAPWVSCIPLDGSASLQEDTPELKYPYGIIIRTSTGHTHFLRACSASEQHIWCSELQDRVALWRENAVLHMAEMIICDEEAARVQRRNKVLMECIRTVEVREALAELLPEMYIRCGRAADGMTTMTPADSWIGPLCSRSRDLLGDSLQRRLSREGSLMEDHRRRENFLHRFHRDNKISALGLALVGAIDNYKSVFRHDISVRAWEVWRLALNVYVEYLLPYVDSTAMDGEVVRTPIAPESTTHLGDSSGGGHSESCWDVGVWHESESRPLTKEKVTRVHEEIFQNIRKVGISVVPGGKGGESFDHQGAVMATGSSIWLWPSAPPIVTDAAAALSRSLSKDHQDSTTSIPSSCFVLSGGEHFEILNMTSRPESTLFDGISGSVIDELDTYD